MGNHQEGDMEPYEMDDPDRALIKLVRVAVEMDDNGDPAKDAMSEDDMICAMRLLLEIIDAGCAS